MIIILYDNGTKTTVVIPEEDKPLHELAKNGKILVLEVKK